MGLHCQQLLQNLHHFGKKTLWVYKASADTGNDISLRCNAGDKFSWYYGPKFNPDKWNLITWKVNNTHSVGYVNGLKTFQKLKVTGNMPSEIKNEVYFNPNLDAGNFSVGPLQLWASGKSPVFIWRLFPEGLNDYDENWELLSMWLLFWDW